MQESKEIKLKINDTELKGNYSNQVNIMHSKHDFVLDFITLFPPEAIVNSRIIMNPANLKKFYKALEVNLKKYEEQFGVIDFDDDFFKDDNNKIN